MHGAGSCARAVAAAHAVSIIAVRILAYMADPFTR